MNEILDTVKDGFKISEFLENSKEFTMINFPGIDLEKIFTEVISGSFNLNDIGLNVFSVLGDNILEIVKILVTVLIVIIINSIFKIVIESLENNSSSKITEFIHYLVVVTIVLDLFINITDEFKEVLLNINNFMNMFLPLITGLMISTGNVLTSSVIQNILFLSTIFISNFINMFLIPFFMITITISVVSNLSNKVKIEKLSNFFKSSIVWCLGIILTIFISLLSLETEITSSVDSLTAKTTKAAVSNFIPVVGKIMGDSVETVIGAFGILKNSVGVIGIVVVLSLTVFPIIKLLIMYILFNLAAVFSEMVADEKIVKLIEGLSDNIKLLLGILISVTIMFIIEIVIVIKISYGLV